MAVDVKQLRIGSHILVNSKRERVGGIRPVKSPFNTFQVIIQHEASDFSSFGYVPSASDMIEPIPITPELLAELGFQYRDNTYWERWFLGGFDIERKDGSSYFDYNNEIRLEYLHELEDLYYLIYGVELIKE